MTEAFAKRSQIASDVQSAEDYNRRWEQLWSVGLKPGAAFDASRSSPSLTNLLRKEPEIANGKSVIVPGCGRGYDLVTFIKAGASKATGLELSPTATADANAYLSSLPEFETEGQRFFSQASVHHRNFFDILKQDNPGVHDTFDVGFDYTFLCALQRDMHQLWADSWAASVKPGGELLTLMFPVAEQMTSSDMGPPFPLTVDLYSQLLSPYFETMSVDKVPDEDSHPGRAGREWMGRWRRRVAAHL